MNEMSGGVVSATTMSCRGKNSSRAQQEKMKLAKSAARRHLACLPKLVEKTRKIWTPRQFSRAANNFSGSSYARRPATTVT